MPSLHETGILAPGRTPRQTRIAGALFVLCGLVMLAIGGVIAVAAFVVPLRPDLLPDGVRYAPATPPETGIRALFSAAGAVLAFILFLALTMLALGGGMVARGRASGRLARLLVILCCGFAALGLLAAFLNDGRIPRLAF